MKTLMCAVNSKYVHSSLAVWYLKAVIKDCTVYESTINRDVNETAREIIGFSPDLIGFSSYIWNIEYIKKLCRIIKAELPDVKILLGGPEVSYAAKEYLSEIPGADFISVGEGETPVKKLAAAIENGGETDGIDGIFTRSFHCEPYVTDEIPPSPYCAEYFETLGGRISYIEGSRGCPFWCAFCLSGRCGTVRFFPIERTKSEMLLLANSGSKTVKFVDRTFNADRDRAREIFRFIAERYGTDIPKGVCFHFEIAGDLIDEKTLAVLKTLPHGAVQFEIGLQSFNPETLSAVHRVTDIDRLCDNIEKLVDLGNIHIHIDLIAGLPYEDLKSFENSFNMAYKLKPHVLQLGFLKLLHGADLRENGDNFCTEYDRTPPYEVVSTPCISQKELEFLHKFEDIFDRVHNSGRFRRTEKYLLDNLLCEPFILFKSMTDFVGDAKIPSLDALCETIFRQFSKCVDSDGLRDCMVLDRMATNRNFRLPSVLTRYDRRLKRLRSIYKSEHTNVEILYSTNKIAVADYRKCDPTTGEFEIVIKEIID